MLRNMIHRAGVFNPAAGGGSFVPSDIAGLQLWLDSSDASTIHATAGVVDTWDDKSGLSHHATASTTTRPATGTRTLDGKNVLDFDGNSDWMLLPSGLYTIPTGPNTTFIVYASDNTGDATQSLMVGANAGTAYRYGDSFTATNFGVQNRSTSSSLTTIADTRDTNPRLSGFRRSGTTITPFINGVKGTDGTNSENFTCTAMLLGSLTNTGANRFNGVMAERILYDSALSDADCNQVGNYLAAKWSVTWTGF